MSTKSGAVSGMGHGGCGAMIFASSNSHCRTHDVSTLRPVRPCHVHANGCPLRVVFVALQVPCSALALSCRLSHSVRCTALPSIGML